jgi:peptide/nickel transport system substrate-binding protein
MRRGLVVLLLAGVTAAAWSTVGSQASTKHVSSGTSVTIANVAGQSWTCNFNPFNSTVQFLSFGPVYEELTFVNALKSGKPTPWLASKYAWSNHAKTLSFTIRNGVKWSDGKPPSSSRSSSSRSTRRSTCRPCGRF